MANKYGSVTRTYTIRNLYQDTLTVGTDIVMPATTMVPRSIPQLAFEMNKDSNWDVSRIGIFSNYADGLVFKHPENRIDVHMQYTGWTFLGDSFVLSLVFGSNLVTTVTGTPGWTPGTVYPVAMMRAPGQYIMMRITATGASAGILEDYWPYETNLQTTYNLSSTLFAPPFEYKSISVLNCMYNVSDFAAPSRFITSDTHDIVSFQALINNQTNHNVTFLTNGINSAFNGQTVYFDMLADIEFTSAD